MKNLVRSIVIILAMSLPIVRPAAQGADFSFADCAPEETLLFLEVANRTQLEEA